LDDLESDNDNNEPVRSPILRKLRTSSRTKNAPKYTFDDDDDDDDDDTLNGVDENSDKDNDYEEISLPPLKSKSKTISTADKIKEPEIEKEDSIIEDEEVIKIKGDDLNVEMIDVNKGKNIKKSSEIKEKNDDDDMAIIVSDNNDKNNDIEVIKDDDDLSIQTISSSSTLKQNEIKSSPKKEFISRISAMKTKKRKSDDNKEKEENEKVEEIKTASRPSRNSRTTSRRRAKVRDIQYLELSDDD